MQFYPGQVARSPLLVARLSGATPWDWLSADTAQGIQHDGDITTAYHETLSPHLLQAARGINTSLVLWGDQVWHSQLADIDILTLVRHCTAALRAPDGGPITGHDGRPVAVQRLVFLTQTFDCATGATHEVMRRDLNGPEAAHGLRGALPASDARTIGLVRLAAAIGDCEAVITIVVPPPYDACTWDVHEYLRSGDEAVLPSNSLKAAVIHCGSAEPPHGEVRLTLAAIRRRPSAPVVNTPAARHLLALLAQQAERPPAAPGQEDWGRARAAELQADVEALEGELVSTRAAFVAAQKHGNELEITLRGARPAAAEPLLLDPPTLERELLRMAEDEMGVLGRDLPALWSRIADLERGAGGLADARVKELLQWRAGEAQSLTQSLSRAPMTVLQGGLVVPAGARLAPDNPALPSAVLQRTAGDAKHAVSGGDEDSSSTGAFSGAEARVLDPVAGFFQQRLAELERDVAASAEVDVKACVDDYFVRELEAAQRELAQWVTRCREAERKRDEYERAVKRTTV
jgi:hypothetical protein